ncbi:MAG: VanW family protein, partial [Acidimicrobiia bacterium]
MRRLTPLLVLVMILAVPGVSAAADLAPGGTFEDDDGNVHEGAIEALVAAGVTNGCATSPALFCPRDPVTREAMAAFLYRALSLEPAGATDVFTDDDTSPFEAEIDALAEAGIASGCGEGLFCPERNVTRAEMATFLVRAFVGEGEFDPVSNAFTDDEGSNHELDIDRIAAIGITVGCGERLFCPHGAVTRAEMASFVTRALGLDPIVPPARRSVRLLAGFTTFHNCCESRVTNIHLMADQLDGLVVQPGEVFSLNERIGPRLESDGYVPAGILLDGELYCCDHPLNIGGGTSQVATTLYNAVFRNGFEIISHKPHSRYISRYPLGIEATLGYTTPDIVFRNDTFTPLTILASYTNTSITFDLLGDDLGRTTSWIVDGTATFSDGGSVTVLRTVQEADGTIRNQT